MPASGTPDDPKLFLSFHGRVLQHLGIQMYQSPVNAIAELVANAWDANAEKVDITLPGPGHDKVIVSDDGHGMTVDECQDFFLSVGRNRRGNDPNERTRAPKLRPVLGRKGIGKFAGFGIAEQITVETTSEELGDRTVFRLKLSELLSDQYFGDRKEIEVLEYEPPSDARKKDHGTRITLDALTMQRRPSPDRFAESMARRFLLRQDQTDFQVSVNTKPLPTSMDLQGVEYVFPGELTDEERPEGLTLDGDWGVETVNGHEVRWRFVTYEEPIEAEELRGITVYAKEKLAQQAFLFNITQGITGQQGVEYLAGQVRADYVDTLPEDLIATERQRMNWEHEATKPLLDWGQERVRLVLRTWVKRRGEERVKKLRERLVSFAPRLDRLGKREAKTVEKALSQIAKLPKLNQEQFEELGEGILTAWEQGRLRDLILDISDAEQMDADDLVNVLTEAKVVTALNTAEAVKTKLMAVWSLKERIEKRELENAVRDFIAENPWLISPEWETFKVERGLGNLIDDLAASVGYDAPVYRGRVDLVLGSGSQLLVLEFMRPGLALDEDHIYRFERYIREIRSALRGNTALQYRTVRGYVVADAIDDKPAMRDKVESLAKEDMEAMDWPTLLQRSVNTWKDFLFVLGMRGPEDFRLKSLLADRKLGPADSAMKAPAAPPTARPAGDDMGAKADGSTLNTARAAPSDEPRLRPKKKSRRSRGRRRK